MNCIACNVDITCKPRNSIFYKIEKYDSWLFAGYSCKLNSCYCKSQSIIQKKYRAYKIK